MHKPVACTSPCELLYICYFYSLKDLNKASTIVNPKRYTVLYAIRHNKVYKGYKRRKVSVLGDV